jgi:single-stranded DNA-specific DHH superfamily exonuclease
MTAQKKPNQKNYHLEDNKKSRKFLGGLSFIFYLAAAYEYFLRAPGNHARASFRSLEIIFGPYVFLVLFASIGTLCFLLMLINESSRMADEAAGRYPPHVK